MMAIAALLPRWIAACIAALALGGCAAPLHNTPSNVAWTPGTPHDMGAPTDLIREHSIVLSFSGGGLRAASLAHGVMTALEDEKTPDGDLLDDVRLVSSVSGGSLTAAYYGLHGRAGLRRFREEVLVPGLEGGLRLTLNPANFVRLARGALNVRADFGDALDGRVFHGATFADLYRNSPAEIRIHATELYHRTPFAFLPAAFRVLCSDLSRYAVADAVAASMAVPMVFSPIVLRTFPESCPPLPEEVALVRAAAQRSYSLRALSRLIDSYREPRVRYLKLADGGLTDNFAVSTLALSRLVYGTPYAPMTPRDAVRVRRLLVVLVDASRGLGGDWLDSEDGPGGIDLAMAAMDSAVDTAANFAADAFDGMIGEWQRSVVAFRCGLAADEAARLGAPPGWNCRDVRFTVARVAIADLPPELRARIDRIPTRLALPEAQIDAAIEGGRAGTAGLAALKDYLAERRASAPTASPERPTPSTTQGPS